MSKTNKGKAEARNKITYNKQEYQAEHPILLE